MTFYYVHVCITVTLTLFPLAFLQLQIKCLVCLAQMLDILDKHIVLDHILPILEQIPNRQPGVLMAMLGNRCNLYACSYLKINVCINNNFV